MVIAVQNLILGEVMSLGLFLIQITYIKVQSCLSSKANQEKLSRALQFMT